MRHICYFSVWQKLEEENQEFFKAYHLRLILKDQIIKFNKLLQTQAELMSQIPPPTAAASVPTPNGFQVPLCKIAITVNSIVVNIIAGLRNISN